MSKFYGNKLNCTLIANKIRWDMRKGERNENERENRHSERERGRSTLAISMEQER